MFVVSLVDVSLYGVRLASSRDATHTACACTGAPQARQYMSVTDTVAPEVFIVDDDPLVLNALSVVLSREGYQVTGFGEGESFLAVAKSRTPTCIILDVQMPGQSGLDILRELNAQQYQAPIFIISGIGDIPMAVEAIKNGAFDFLEKPFDA